MDTFKVTVKKASDIVVEFNLMSDEDLSKFSTTAGEITNVRSHYAVPGYLYEELGEASVNHPCAGSACMLFQDSSGNNYSIDVIVCYDYNPNHSHFGGEVHWNIDKRYMKNGTQIARSKNFAGHQISDSKEITIESDYNGKIHIDIISRI